MGSLCQGTTTNTGSAQNVLSGTQIPTWASEAGQQLYSQAANLAQQDITPYTGPRVASLAGPEQQAITAAQQNIGAYQPFLTEAQALTQQGAQQWSPEAMNQYMNPWQQGVTDVAARELGRQFDVRRAQEDAAAVQAGAFGGSRHGVLGSESERARQQAMADLYLKSGALGHEHAMQGFQADQARALGAGGQMGSLGQVRSSLGAGDVGQLMTTGALERDVTQRSMNTAYDDFLEQREWPYRQLGVAIGALKGVPYETRQFHQTQGTQQVPGASPLAQTAGALTGLYSGYKLLSAPRL